MFDRDLLPFIAELNTTIMWIALTVGLLLFIIGYFAGGRLTMSRVVMCTIVVTVLSVLALPAPMAIYKVIKNQFDIRTVHLTPPDDASQPSGSAAQAGTTKTVNDSLKADEKVPISFQVVTLVMYIVWTAFLVAMGILFYETLIVTAQEADRR